MKRTAFPLATTSRRPLPDDSFEIALRKQGYTAAAGVDEVGRGTLAGPVVAGAVILPVELPADGLELIRDSKQLTPDKRDRAAAYIEQFAVGHACGAADAGEIDRFGIVAATRIAMGRAVDLLEPVPDHLLIDALELPGVNLPQTSMIKGDARCRSIAAASIIAKVTRDRLMTTVWDSRFPGYGFASHKGYGTATHLEALRELGPITGHRLTFAPVREAVAIYGTPARGT
ncbi:MAG TPA: ribonuclease HII [Dehalococcoidia bacterium]|nr:ribonuclease HII [Chloroflexota bacterium]HCV28037.1 ribonuclease HII [Dehalococcoidia bacterium]